MVLFGPRTYGKNEKADHYPYIEYFHYYNYRGAFFRSVCNRECADMGCRFNQSCLCGGCGFFDLVFLSVSVLQKANPFFETMDSVYALSALRKKIQGRYVKQVFPEKARKPAYRFSEKQECFHTIGRHRRRLPMRLFFFAENVVFLEKVLKTLRNRAILEP